MLSQAAERRHPSMVAGAELGSRVSAAAFERFEGYWSTPRSLLTDSAGALSAALLSLAEGYEQRDAEDAGMFEGGVRAI
ncbi:hypothetical protein [Leifsonia shinshuensis]|uniref:Uncharacterized protein n=1 Tax=Leifsonia shinshuensis TaxID=150026 RepID=A0A7G6Y7C3_9MICO|nr:hypothetical protein [Leifsonia shinshuensis]QNE34388.1 hypothetical protein F1C12_04050 [Leifsonia shinshuensis]